MDKKKSNKEKSRQLGSPYSTARSKLMRNVLFRVLQEFGKNICHRCNKQIENSSQLSIDHIKDWMYADDPVGLFYDLDNVAFSHQSCNSAASRCSHKINAKIGYKGVSLHEDGKKRNKKYRASISSKKLGTFATAEEAARVYDKAAIEKYGERAVTNVDLGLL